MKPSVKQDFIEFAVNITTAWVSNSNNRVAVNDVVIFLRTIHDAVSSLKSTDATQDAEEQPADVQRIFTPAVSVRKSLASPDHIISMIDGKPYRTLRRHLAAHGLTPDEYRARYNLRPDYPMVAQSYSERRRVLAQEIGLGRRNASSAGGRTKPRGGKPKR